MAKTNPTQAPVQLKEVIAAAGVDSATDEASAPAAAGVDSATDEASAPAEPLRRAFVRTVYGDMVNVLTAEQLDSNPKKVNIDQWVQAQLDAGKLVEGEPE